MNYKVKVIFVGLVEGDYEKISQVYLIPANSFGDAEKAVITMVKEHEDPKEDTVSVTTMGTYSVDKVFYDESEVFEEEKPFFEAVLQTTDRMDNGNIKKIKNKMLVQSENINKAREKVLNEHGLSDTMFNDEKLISIKEVDVYKSLI